MEADENGEHDPEIPSNNGIHGDGSASQDDELQDETGLATSTKTPNELPIHYRHRPLDHTERGPTTDVRCSPPLVLSWVVGSRLKGRRKKNGTR